MNYNMQVHIERVNGKFMAQMEVSGIGRAKRDRVSTDSLAEALEKIAAFHATTYAELEDFHRPPAPVTPQVHMVDGFYHLAECKGDCGAMAGCASQWQPGEIAKMSAAAPALEFPAALGENDTITAAHALAHCVPVTKASAAPKIDRRTKEGKRQFALAK